MQPKGKWISRLLCSRPNGFAIQQALSSKRCLTASSRVAALRLWNFNSSDGLTKGVREIEASSAAWYKFVIAALHFLFIGGLSGGCCGLASASVC